jgi:hypothetical protein
MLLFNSEIDNNIFEVNINLEDVKINLKDIRLILGYSEAKMPAHFEETINEIILKVPQKCNIRAGYKILNVEKNDKKDNLLVGGVLFKTDRIVAAEFKEAERAALFVCTIGSAMEKWSKELMFSGDAIRGYFVDIIASATAEAVANILHDQIKKQMLQNGVNVTNRYSPGYCNWSVAEQHFLFSLLPKNFCGVTLTESALMTPIKSVSGIIGIGSKVKFNDYLCDGCNQKNCTYRSKRSVQKN